jgi:hypothetical protein
VDFISGTCPFQVALPEWKKNAVKEKLENEPHVPLQTPKNNCQPKRKAFKPSRKKIYR